MSLRYRREDEEPAGKTNVSSRRPVSFPTRSRDAYTSGPCLRESCGTSRWRRGGWGPLMAVRGSWGAGTAGGCGIGCKRIAVLVGSRFG